MDASLSEEPVPTELRVEHRLAVYGTLAPGRSNEHIMSGIDGTWTPGVVRGTRYAEGWGAAEGYPGIILDDAGDVDCVLFESPDLPQHWAMLDEFEGEGYQRVTTRVRIGDTTREAYIYELSGR